jgi:acyl-CoA reductase-like NAD-dependent aldehyde dehydrogenase
MLIGATSGMQVASDETVFPLTPIFANAEEDELVVLANATDFSLAR